MPELRIGTAVAPVVEESDIYDLTYQFDLPTSGGSTPCPQINDPGMIDLLSNPTMVYHDSGQTIYRTRLYAGGHTATVSFSIANPANPRSEWRVNDGTTAYWSAIYGLLPSNYSASSYEFVKMNKLETPVSYERQLLFSTVNGKYTPIGCCYALSSSAVYYECVLKKLSDGSYVTVSGSSSDFRVSNSPYGSYRMTYFMPLDTFVSNGDMKGQILMTETPRN